MALIRLEVVVLWLVLGGFSFPLQDFFTTLGTMWNVDVMTMSFQSGGNGTWCSPECSGVRVACIPF